MSDTEGIIVSCVFKISLLFAFQHLLSCLGSPPTMKTTIQLIALAVLSIAFSSCGSMTAQKKVTTYTESQRTVYDGKSSYVVTDRVPHTTTKKVRHCCNKCGSSYCAKPQCCGIVSPKVLARATAQGGTGEPQIGLIPTMKILAP